MTVLYFIFLTFQINMKSLTVIVLALAAVIGLVVADYGYGGYGSYGSAGGAGYTYMPAYGGGYGAGSGFGNNQCM
jgi:hypothetical protein